MVDMELYERVDDVLENQDKPNSSLIEHNEGLQRKHQKENTKKVSTCVFNTLTGQYCWLLFMVMASTSLSIAALVLATTAKFDGSWSSWANWEACSTTCDVGMQKRGRSCSDPAPRWTGRQCLGMDMEVRLCQSGPCRMDQTIKVDGSWSSWTNWEACSSSCDVGMQKRGRNCSNPAPLGTGRQCLGTDMEVKLCQSEPCRMDQTTTKGPSENVIADVVAFHAFKAADLSLSENQTIVFQESIMNEGMCYNSATGVFTAPFSGIYQFSGQLCSRKGKAVDFSLMHGNRYILRGYYNEKDYTGTCSSFSAPAIVKQNEQVRVVYDWRTSTSDILYQDDDDWNTFSGVLIRELN